MSEGGDEVEVLPGGAGRVGLPLPLFRHNLKSGKQTAVAKAKTSKSAFWEADITMATFITVNFAAISSARMLTRFELLCLST